MATGHLTGNYYVRRLDCVNADAKHLFRRTRDLILLRRHALKLRYWPAPRSIEPSEQAVDLDWSMIRALSGLDIHELRIHETIGGNDNLRVIFFVGPTANQNPKARDLSPLTCIWILAVIQKGRTDFTRPQLANFRIRRQIVLTRHYT